MEEVWFTVILGMTSTQEPPQKYTPIRERVILLY